jgi:CNT family concentrative nucleoside transporter
LADGQHYFPGPDAGWPGFGFQFAFKVLPTIIFFGGFMSVLYYLGIMQKLINSLSRFMRWTVGTSGAETLSCSANIFVGQTEAPLLIKPFIKEMTISELTTIMVGGFATIAGGVLAGYIAMGVPAGHLVAASVMSAPAALVIGKIIFPEKEHSATAGDVELPVINVGSNAIEAASNGITDGLKLAVNVGAMLIGFIALIAVIDVLLNWLDYIIDGKLFSGAYIVYKTAGMSPATGEFIGYFPGSLQTFFGTLLKPLAFLMGVPWENSHHVGNLLGIKLSLNEFVAYGTLGSYISENMLSERGIIISTYALCGFANFSSIGIQLGGISALAPERKSDLARIGLRAMFGGAIASWLTATIAGILI